MLQIEIFENRDRSPLLCGGFPVCQRYTRRQKSLLYSFPLSPSSSGQGRHPFKVDIAGSNPAGGTIYIEKPVTLRGGGLFATHTSGFEPDRCGFRHLPMDRVQKMANMSTVTDLVTANSAFLMVNQMSNQQPGAQIEPNLSYIPGHMWSNSAKTAISRWQ